MNLIVIGLILIFCPIGLFGLLVLEIASIAI